MQFRLMTSLEELAKRSHRGLDRDRLIAAELTPAAVVEDDEQIIR